MNKEELEALYEFQKAGLIINISSVIFISILLSRSIFINSSFEIILNIFSLYIAFPMLMISNLHVKRTKRDIENSK